MGHQAHAMAASRLASIQSKTKLVSYPPSSTAKAVPQSGSSPMALRLSSGKFVSSRSPKLADGVFHVLGVDAALERNLPDGVALHEVAEHRPPQFLGQRLFAWRLAWDGIHAARSLAVHGCGMVEYGTI